MTQFDARPALVPTVEARALQTILAVTAVLPLTTLEILARVEQELQDNPVLERLPTPCAQCGQPVEGLVCGRCGYSVLGGLGRLSMERIPQSELGDRPSALDLAEAPENLLDHLEAQLRVTVRDRAILAVALHLVGYVDPRGYLDADLEYVAAELGVPYARVEEALRALQACDPAGVGARCVRECLLLQLERLDPSAERDLARMLVQEHLEALSRGQLTTVAAKLGVEVEAVHGALRYLRRHTVPWPAEAFRSEHGGGRVRPEELAIPDVVISRTEQGYRVEVVAASALQLRIHPLVRQALAHGGLGPEERERVRDLVRRGRLFIETVRRRNVMLYRCAEYVVRYQRAFLDHGPVALRPLTLSQVALALGVCESTVSRALTGKFVQMPDGRVVPFEVFFDSSLPVRRRIRELVNAEDPRKPLTDEALARCLESEGWRLARRTVTKYREMARIPSARARRRWAALQEAAM